MLYDVYDVQCAAFCPKARSLPSTLILVRPGTVQTSVCTFVVLGGIYELI